MLWTPWTASASTVLVVSCVLGWWLTEPKKVHLNLCVTIACMVFLWVVAPELAVEVPVWLFEASVNVATFLRLDYLVVYHTNMLVTGAAVLWYVLDPPGPLSPGASAILPRASARQLC
jgi:hypothetical protein